jgi:hypothetical protein
MSGFSFSTYPLVPFRANLQDEPLSSPVRCFVFTFFLAGKGSKKERGRQPPLKTLPLSNNRKIVPEIS